MSDVAPRAFSFPNFIWERPVLLAKFHFALTWLSNKIAPTISFPNEIWERETHAVSTTRNAKGVAILMRRVGAPAPTLEMPGNQANLEKVESVRPNAMREGEDSTFSRLVALQSKTRVGAVRQPFALLSQRLWRCGRSSEAAQTSAFPNGVWERGEQECAY